jgi:hypothetical protein
MYLTGDLRLVTLFPDVCYVPPDNGAHFPLSHNHFDKWAAAMVLFFFADYQKILVILLNVAS